MDLPLLLFGLLLAATVIAFLSGLFPYPFGLIVLSAFFIGRLLMIRPGTRQGSGHGH